MWLSCIQAPTHHTQNRCMKICHTHTCTQPFYCSVDFVLWTTQLSRYQKVHFAIFWIFWSKMKITQADAPTIWMDCLSIQSNWCPHLCHPHYFYAGCLSLHNSPNLSWLGTGTKYAGLHIRCWITEVSLNWTYFHMFHLIVQLSETSVVQQWICFGRRPHICQNRIRLWILLKLASRRLNFTLVYNKLHKTKCTHTHTHTTALNKRALPVVQLCMCYYQP